ncbi:hypothetical protein GCM10010415_64720 [Streptomyces atrovirens]
MSDPAHAGAVGPSLSARHPNRRGVTGGPEARGRQGGAPVRSVTAPAARRPSQTGTRDSAPTISSTRVLASPKSIWEFSRKNSGFCTPA